MIMSCYLLTFYTTFVPYELTDNFSCDPPSPSTRRSWQ